MRGAILASLLCTVTLAAKEDERIAHLPDLGRPGRVLAMNVDGPISTGVAEYFEAAIAKAKAEGFDALAVTMDTPGGLLDATREIVKGMLASEIPIIIYVGPAGARAGSAGVFITMAGHVAAMHPTSNIGAAHPVTSSGGDVEKEAGKEMAKKIENDTVAFVQGIAKSRHRNVEWAEKAVRDSVSVTAEEAVKLKVVDLVAPDLRTALDQIDGKQVETASGWKKLKTRNATIESLPMTVRQRTLAVLADPNIVALLFMIGMLGIGLEFYHPGSIYPGAIGALCLLVAFLAMKVIPVNIGAVLLLIVGVGLLVSEAYITSHGIAGLGGAVCLVLGTLLFIDKSSPDYHFDPGALTLSPVVVWPTPLALAGVLAFVGIKIFKSRHERLVAGPSGLMGEVGEALSAVGPSGGEVFVHGEYWKARSSAEIAKGARVRVTAVDGLALTVVAAEPTTG